MTTARHVLSVITSGVKEFAARTTALTVLSPVPLKWGKFLGREPELRCNEAEAEARIHTVPLVQSRWYIADGLQL